MSTSVAPGDVATWRENPPRDALLPGRGVLEQRTNLGDVCGRCLPIASTAATTGRRRPGASGSRRTAADQVNRLAAVGIGDLRIRALPEQNLNHGIMGLAIGGAERRVQR